MRITNFLVCDDVRHEVGGKATVVGIYNDLGIPYDKKDAKFPLKLHLGFYMRIKMDASDKKIPDAFDFEFLQGDKKEIAVNKGKIVAEKEPKYIVLTVVFSQFPVKSDEPIKFKIKFYKSDVQICELEPDFAMNVILKNPQEAKA